MLFFPLSIYLLPSYPLLLPSPPSTAFCMLIGLGSFFKAFNENDSVEASWSYTVGWLAFALALICLGYFIVVAMYRLKTAHQKANMQAQVYAPLAQFESTETDDDDNEDNL